jgi:hypothetical protein
MCLPHISIGYIKMELNLLHLFMETTAAVCLFFIAWINIRYNATGIYSGLMAIGTTIAGVTDLTHALVPIVYPQIAEHWMLMSWGASRITLIIMFMMVFLCYDVIKCRLPNLIIILTIPLLFSIFMAASDLIGVGGFTLGLHPIVIFGTVVNCTFDLILLGLWLATAIILRKKAHILFPPHVYWLFMSLGIMVHAIMSFASAENLDMASFLAHGLKVAEYYSFILIYLLYKSSHDRLPKKSREEAAKLINTNDCSRSPALLELNKGKH